MFSNNLYTKVKITKMNKTQPEHRLQNFNPIFVPTYCCFNHKQCPVLIPGLLFTICSYFQHT